MGPLRAAMRGRAGRSERRGRIKSIKVTAKRMMRKNENEEREEGWRR